ncbi:MAG: hypothetical protein WC980_05935 [Candidatus Brocadiia bacterium]
MKNTLLAFAILGIISAIIAVFIAFSNSEKAITAMNQSEQAKTMAERIKDIAEKAKDDALAAKKESDAKAIASIEDARKARDEANQARTERERSLADAIKIEKDARETEKKGLQMQDDAKALVALANGERDKAYDAAKVAQANEEVEKEARRIAEQERDKMARLAENSRKDYATLKQIIRQQEMVAIFTSDIINKILVSIDTGDQHYLKGLEEWQIAKDIKQRTITLGNYIKAKELYTAAQNSIGKIEKVNDQTEEIKFRVKNGVANDIASLDIVIDILRRLIKGETISNQDLQSMTDQAISKKLSADNTVIDACKAIVDIINGNPGVTPSLAEKLEQIKKAFEERMGAGNPGENALILDRKFS